MWRSLFQTSNERTLTVVRVALGVMMFAHGAQKLLGWFGGYGFEGTMGYFTGQGLPAALAATVIVGEFLAGLGLIGGLFTRISAGGTIAIMLGAIAMVHWPNGYFMNWGGQAPGEGFELHTLALAIAVMLLVKGAGAFSLDRVVSQALEPAEIPVEPGLNVREPAVR